jgi:hypothetical protein
MYMRPAHPKIVAFTLKHNTDVLGVIRRWVTEAKGELRFKELCKKFQKRYGYEPMWSTDPKEIKRLGLMGHALKIEAGKVSFIRRQRDVAA